MFLADIRRGVAYGTLEGADKCVHNFDRESEGNRSLGEPTCKWEVSIKVDVKQVEWDGGG